MAVALILPAATAEANPYTEVASAFDDEDSFDLHVTVDYGFTIRRAEIKREWNRNFENDPVLASDPLPVVKDLLLEGSRHFVVPRMELGLFTDLSLSVAMPIVITDSRTLKFDDRAGDLVNRVNSTTIVDGLLPQNGFNAADPASGFAEGSTIFRGPNRAGLDQLHLGLAWAPMNQNRDRSKPFWKIGAEARLAIGSPMKLDRMDPDSETSVGRGVHEVRVWTSIAKRIGWAEPFFELWWLAPLGNAGDSPFEEVGFGQNRADLQQQAGTRFGFHAVAWSQGEFGNSLVLDFSARLAANFEGRAYTPMWEVFQFAGDVDGGGPLILDADPTEDDVQPLAHPGITNVENYLQYGGRVGLTFELGPKVRFGGAFELAAAQDHAISFADAGVDSDDPDDTVTPGTDEVNPTHVQTIDEVGNRYRIEESVDFMLLVDARLLF